MSISALILSFRNVSPDKIIIRFRSFVFFKFSVVNLVADVLKCNFRMQLEIMVALFILGKSFPRSEGIFIKGIHQIFKIIFEYFYNFYSKNE
jgi:hypothetical protein